ncbi:MAG: hypothetical protein PVI40_03580 [Chlamydiota bacterium]|jgi:hypothetical protein
MNTVPFFISLFFHIVGLVLAFGSVIVTDLFGLLWIFNRIRFPHLVSISNETKNFIWLGWVIMIMSGIPLIYLKGEIDNLMVIKLFFVALIGINGVFLHKIHEKIQNYKKGEHVPNITMFHLVLGLFISQLAWWCALAIGFVHRHIQSVINWPPFPFLVCISIAVGLIIIWKVGERVFNEKK